MVISDKNIIINIIILFNTLKYWSLTDEYFDDEYKKNYLLQITVQNIIPL